MDIYLTKYNNYFNRQVKVPNLYATPTDYADFIMESITGVNFNPNDDVDTKLLLNTYYDCNYMLMVNAGEINSRWFVIEKVRLRNGQYEYTLKRDVIADNYEKVIEAPIFIEKATLDNSDPMIFNSEGMNFNKIKRSEYELRDPSLCGWIVGYTQKTGIDIASMNYEGEQNVITQGTFEGWDYANYATFTRSEVPTAKFKTSINVQIGANEIPSGHDGLVKTWFVNKAGEVVSKNTLQNEGRWTVSSLVKSFPTVAAYLNTNTFANRFNTFAGFQSNDGRSAIDVLKDRIIQFGDRPNKYYKINIEYVRKYTTDEGSEPKISTAKGDINSSAGGLQVTLLQKFSEDIGSSPTISTENCVKYIATYIQQYIYLEEVSILASQLNIEQDSEFLKEAEDAEYCIFAIPCPKKGDSILYRTYMYTYEKSMAMAQMLVRQLQPASTGGHLIDIQLLPYNPTDNNKYSHVLEYKDSDATVVGEAFCLKKSSFTIQILKSINVTEPKIENECDVWRMVSPNYASSYEFSVAKNGGVQFFHVNCTYKPYTPFIDIHPNYNAQGLYGQDFDDNRGLILAGDYSLPVTSDAFLSYQIQNKNYSNIFDRQMQNMDIQNAWGMAQTAVGAVAGTVQGAAMGAMAGGIPGAIAGGVASAAGGVADIAMTDAMQKENKSYATDMYKYNLGNVDSKPNSLVKSSAFDINNKMFPILEYITCTDVEKEALRSKLKYNGMTVMRIGKIEDYLNGNEQYIQGQLIRLQLNDDAHIVNAIADELAKGVYFEGE